MKTIQIFQDFTETWVCTENILGEEFKYSNEVVGYYSKEQENAL